MSCGMSSVDRRRASSLAWSSSSSSIWTRQSSLIHAAYRGRASRIRHTSTMPKVIYTAGAHVTGGRADGHGETSDNNLSVDLRMPPELGGQGGGTNPEELFAVGFAACFESALGAVARRERTEIGDVSVDSRVTLSPNQNRGYDLGVRLDFTLPGVAPDEAVRLVSAAH